jgi:hypothetical protein
MAGGRPPKFNPERAAVLVEHLRAGCTRKAAAEAVGVRYETFRLWLERGSQANAGPFFEFLGAATHAEAEAENRYAAILEKAAEGWEAGAVTRTVKTVYRTRKTTTIDPETNQKTVIEEPVALEEVTEATTSERLFDWRAAESWLKRRRREEWGDTLDVRKLGDDQLIRLLEEDARRRSTPAGPAGADPPAARNGKH